MRLILLGLVQGLTEFLPVSSSGHLVLFQRLFGFEEHVLAFDLLLHVATALSIVVFLRAELWQLGKDSMAALGAWRLGTPLSEAVARHPGARIPPLLVLAMLPAIVVGLSLNDWIDAVFSSPLGAAVGLVITGFVLFATQYASGRRDTVSGRDALIIGCAQAVAIFPGVSRSGMTIAAAMGAGMEKTAAARFSFLLALPTIMAAAIYKLPQVLGNASLPAWPVTVLALVVAFASGLAALRLLSRLVARARFHVFAFYVWAVAAIVFVVGRG